MIVVNWTEIVQIVRLAVQFGEEHPHRRSFVLGWRRSKFAQESGRWACFVGSGEAKARATADPSPCPFAKLMGRVRDDNAQGGGAVAAGWKISLRAAQRIVPQISVQVACLRSSNVAYGARSCFALRSGDMNGPTVDA